MINYTKILKSILMRNKWVNNETTYTFTSIEYSDSWYTFSVQVKHDRDVSFLFSNLYDYADKLVKSAFDILDIEEVAVDFNLLYFGPNQFNGEKIDYRGYYISEKDKLKTLKRFNEIPFLGSTGDGLYNGKSNNFYLVIHRNVDAISFTFETEVNNDLDKKIAEKRLMTDMINNQMSGFLLNTYEQQFLTPNNDDWAFLTDVKII
jgi:hypothetical protein